MSEYLYALMRERQVEDNNDELIGLFNDQEKAVAELVSQNLYVLKLRANKVYDLEYWDEDPEIELIDFDYSTAPVYSALP